MISNDITETGKVANVKIFVGKPIARITWFRNFKTRASLLEMPPLDDIVICCCSLVNLLSPLIG